MRSKPIERKEYNVIIFFSVANFGEVNQNITRQRRISV
jgi:hypothetical protein